MPREYPEMPVLAVGVLILNKDQVLLARRAQDPGRGLWSVPGGVVELGETLEEAARREVREECALDVEIGHPIHISEVIVPDSGSSSKRIRFHYVIIYFIAHYRSGQPAPGSDSLEVRWAGKSAVDELEMPDGLREIVRKAWQRPAYLDLELD